MILSGSVAASGSPCEVLEAWRRGDFILVTRGDIISPDNNKLLACAIEGEADYIVSGDHYLLDSGSYRNISIVRPAVFLQVLRVAG